MLWENDIHGTHVLFYPEASYFDSVQLNIKALSKLLRAKAFLLPSLQVEFTVADATPEKSQTERWQYSEGILSYLKVPCKTILIYQHKTHFMAKIPLIGWLYNGHYVGKLRIIMT